MCHDEQGQGKYWNCWWDYINTITYYKRVVESITSEWERRRKFVVSNQGFKMEILVLHFQLYRSCKFIYTSRWFIDINIRWKYLDIFNIRLYRLIRPWFSWWFSVYYFSYIEIFMGLRLIPHKIIGQWKYNIFFYFIYWNITNFRKL